MGFYNGPPWRAGKNHNSSYRGKFDAHFDQVKRNLVRLRGVVRVI